MAKKLDPKPLFSIKHEFISSLNRYTEESEALASFMRTAIKHNLINEKVRDIAEERLAAFDRACR